MKRMKHVKFLLAACFVMLAMFGNSALKADAASPGLYNSKGKMIYSWKQLTGDSLYKGGVLVVKNGVLTVSDEEPEIESDDTKYPWDYLKGKLVIKSNVTAIGAYAFSGYGGLTEIVLPNGLKTIGKEAFSGTGIKKLYIPKNVTTIKSGITAGCNKLTKITVSSSNKKYNSKNECNAIIKTSTKELVAACKNTKIPKNIKSIGISAFSGLNIKKITIPSGVTTIKEHAFESCTYLKEVKLPSTLKKIDYGAFDECIYLKKINLPSGLKSIGEFAFQFCDSLNDFTVPKSVTKIGYAAFRCVPVVHHQTNLKGTYDWEADAVHKAVAGKCSKCGKKITITFNPNGGKCSIKTKKIYNKMTYVGLPYPSRTGYSFEGWYTKKTGGKMVEYYSKSVSTSSHTLYARWKIKYYKIKYNYNGGIKINEQDNPTSYTIKQTVKLASPKRDGYTFKGWYQNGKKISSIPKGTTGKIELTAKWTKK